MGIVSGGLCTVWWLPFRTDARPPLMTTPLPAGPCARLGRCPSAMRGCRRGRPPRLPWPLCLPKVWPGTGGRAYQDKDSVNVVGHNDKWFGLHAGIEGGHLVVQPSGRSFRVLQPHCPIHHLAEQEFTVLGADRQRIRTPLCVIVRRSIGGGIDTVSRVILSGFLWGCRRVGTGAWGSYGEKFMACSPAGVRRSRFPSQSSGKYLSLALRTKRLHHPRPLS